jgi:hypothetical protein
MSKRRSAEPEPQPIQIVLNVTVPDGAAETLVTLVTALLNKGTLIMADLTRLTQEVAENTTVIESAVTLIEGLAQQIRDNIADQAKLEELADQLDSEANALAAKIAENTPAPPE